MRMKNGFRVVTFAVAMASGLWNAQAWSQNDANGAASSAAVDSSDRVANSLGDTAADLAFTPVAPCRIVDTRTATGGVLVAGVQRSFLARNGGGFATQGGSATDCGIATTATAVEMNLVAVGAAGPGDLRAFAFGGTLPTASVLNYANVGGLNIANGIAQPVCNPATATCTNDFTILADVSNTHLVIDVVGYYKAVVRPTIITLTDSPGSTASTTPIVIASTWADLLAKGYTKARLVARFNNSAEAPACVAGGTATLEFYDSGRATVLASINRTCGIRAWYDQTAPFDIQVATSNPGTPNGGTPYDLRVFVDSGTASWRWAGLEIW
jgi:hypothetical protein